MSDSLCPWCGRKISRNNYFFKNYGLCNFCVQLKRKIDETTDELNNLYPDVVSIMSRLKEKLYNYKE